MCITQTLIHYIIWIRYPPYIVLRSNTLFHIKANELSPHSNWLHSLQQWRTDDYIHKESGFRVVSVLINNLDCPVWEKLNLCVLFVLSAYDENPALYSMTTDEEVHARELLYSRPSSPVFSNISIIVITIVVLIIRV